MFTADELASNVSARRARPTSATTGREVEPAPSVYDGSVLGDSAALAKPLPSMSPERRRPAAGRRGSGGHRLPSVVAVGSSLRPSLMMRLNAAALSRVRGLEKRSQRPGNRFWSARARWAVALGTSVRRRSYSTRPGTRRASSTLLPDDYDESSRGIYSLALSPRPCSLRTH